MYKQAIDRYSMLINSELDKMEVIYNFDYGDEFEIACCNIIKSLLPSKYGVCRGHLFTKEGEQAGDDIIIYDCENNPSLRLLPIGDYSRKEYIPIDSAYAYIEAKHNLTFIGEKNSFDKALKQVAKAKSLPRKIRNHNEIMPGFTMETTFELGDNVDPARANPLFGAIISKKMEVNEGFKEKLKMSNEPNIDPDLIIAGSDYIGLPMQHKDGRANLRVFRHTGNTFTIREIKNNAFALGILAIVSALHFIDLAPINWHSVIIKKLNEGIIETK